jgi:hypothetical protein
MESSGHSIWGGGNLYRIVWDRNRSRPYQDPDTESPRPPPFRLFDGLDVLKRRLRRPSVRGQRIFSTFDTLVMGFMTDPG